MQKVFLFACLSFRISFVCLVLFLVQNIQCKKTTDSCYNILYFTSLPATILFVLALANAAHFYALIKFFYSEYRLSQYFFCFVFMFRQKKRPSARQFSFDGGISKALYQIHQIKMKPAVDEQAHFSFFFIFFLDSPSLLKLCCG